MKLEDIHKIVLAEAVADIIKDYKEALALEPGMSDYRLEHLKINAFDDILTNVKWYLNKEDAL